MLPSAGVVRHQYLSEENGVTYTVSYLAPNKFTNLANVLAAATNPTYQTAWKGKWHLSGPKSGTWSAADIAFLNSNFQMQQWNPPDAGTSYGGGSDIGGGTPNNDGRFVNGVTPNSGQTQGWGNSAVDFINNQPLGSPWCLVVSLVNPHDVLLYPTLMSGTGYPASALNDLGIALPENMNDNLATSLRSRRRSSPRSIRHSH